MLSEYVLPGDKIELTPAHQATSADETDERKVYKTKVFDVASDEELKVVMPMEKGKLILLPVDKEYDLCFYSKGGLYQCFATVRDRYKNNNIFVLSLEVTSNLRKFQRREYYRLNCILNMKCTSVDDNQIALLNQCVEFIETDFTLQDGVIVDISGGGVRFISNNRYDRGDRILFVFNLTVSAEAVPYQLVGRIVLSDPIEGREGEYENRVQFLDINKDDREGIIRFIFEEERKNRRREKN